MSKKVHLKEDGDRRDLLGVCLVTMAEMTAVRQIKGHDTLMWLQQSCVNLKKKRKDYNFWHQLNRKPRIITGSPSCEHMHDCMLKPNRQMSNCVSCLQQSCCHLHRMQLVCSII